MYKRKVTSLVILVTSCTIHRNRYSQGIKRWMKGTGLTRCLILFVFLERIRHGLTVDGNADGYHSTLPANSSWYIIYFPWQRFSMATPLDIYFLSTAIVHQGFQQWYCHCGTHCFARVIKFLNPQGAVLKSNAVPGLSSSSSTDWMQDRLFEEVQVQGAAGVIPPTI